MSVNKFKVGDRVRLNIDLGYDGIHNGSMGTVCHPKERINSLIGVECDKFFGGHNCGNRCKDPHGLYVESKNIEHMKILVVGKSGCFKWKRS